MRTRHLTLRREPLAALTTDELAGVAAGAIPPPTPPSPRTLPVNDCLLSQVVYGCADTVGSGCGGTP